MGDKKERLSTESYKGVRDFYPEDFFVENYIFNTWKKTCESFGYVEYSASILEHSEIYKAKSSEEIVDEQTYSFKDRGDRDVTLRPEMTPTVARMVAHKKRELSFPLRWYSIPNLFRYERPQKGRLREHFQLNADIFGVSSIEAEVEIITLAHTLLKNFGFKDENFVIRVNDKSFFRRTLKDKGLSDEKIKKAGALLDKKTKSKSFDKDWEKLTGLPYEENLFRNPEVETFVEKLKERGIPNAIPNFNLVRGFEYYSGVVFEVFDTNPENIRSIFGGGRYDNLVELFSGEEVPAVGFGMGDVTLIDALEIHGLLPKYKSPIDLYVCILEEKFAKEATELGKRLRNDGLKVSVDLSFKKVGDQIKKADKDKVLHIVCVGEEEVSSQKYKLKNLETGEETLVDYSDIISALRK